MTDCYSQLVSFLSSQNSEFYAQFNRGIEREALRMQDNGHLGEGQHDKKLGSALTHRYITTDYAESLLEFITPVESHITTSLQQLSDIQKFTLAQLNGQYLWPLSMPCFIGQESDIQLAYYGESNIGKMKTLYREGLRNRYGSMMQVISGVHFNFSFPTAFWEKWANVQGLNFEQASISAGYLATIRNLKRHLWLLPYLFGASPALCGSFLAGKESQYDFKKVGKGTLYLPYATSLRLSDLGYTNTEQDDLKIEYNNLTDYIAGIRQAINLPSKQFEHIGIKVEGQYKQLNANVLQIENEFYSAIRPKRVTLSGETPTQALESKGIQYMEVRALDVDPFSPLGVSDAQLRFIDILLIWCACQESAPISQAEQVILDANMQQVILQGRQPDLLLQQSDQQVDLKTWGLAICQQLLAIATAFDSTRADSAYQDAISQAIAKFNDSNKTPSAKLLKQLVDNDMDNVTLGLQLAKTYRQQAMAVDYQIFDDAYLKDEAERSLLAQQQIETDDDIDFDGFLVDYFK